MIWFWIVAALLILVALAALLWPLISRAGRGAGEGEAAVAMFRRQLADIDTELAQGRLACDEASATRTEITRRMLAAADRELEEVDLAAANPTEAALRVGAAVGVAGLLPVAALVIYFAVGAPAVINPPATAETARGTGPHDATELAAAADQLKARLEREPDHPEGWVLLGRTLASLQRFGEARDAYGRAITFKPDEPQLHAELGEVLVLAAGGTVTPAAEAEFTKSANDPRARFYGAEAALQRGDNAAARAALQALLADAPADAPWRKIVAARLAEIAPGEPEAGAKSPAGPTAQDIAAAQSMSPEERQAMIRSMVERLAARLEQQPDDKEGWIRLAHAYDVLGETDKAKAARAHAEAVGSSLPPSPSSR
ncbi:MAG: c-type cytochrome biogenesis protein CcmI [Alphaproteobacteria bacterium]|nr:c-type cytochrome biogenesis protein CcmI [Alphaproteobacteria bacterium]